jgi:hypothetical protein
VAEYYGAYEMCLMGSFIEHFSSQVVELFWEAVETLAGKTCLEEVGSKVHENYT